MAPLGRKPAPLQLVYGSESSVDPAELGRVLSSARRRRRRVSYLGFLGTTFRDASRGGGRSGGAGRSTSRAFRTLGRKLSKGADESTDKNDKINRKDGRKDGNALQLEELEIRHVPGVGNDAVLSLAPFLNSTNTLRRLDLTGGTFDADALRKLGPFFKSPSLEAVILGDNVNVGDKGAEVVTSSLAEGEKGRMRVLALENAGLTPISIPTVANFLLEGGGEYLRTLELSGNVVGDSGARVLADAIGSGHPLVRLGLNDAEIGDMGAIAFTSVLGDNRTLSALTLQKNPITDAGASKLLDVICDRRSIKSIAGSNHTLRDVNLRGCAIKDDRLLRTLMKLACRCRLLETEHEVIRAKITAHVEDAGRDGSVPQFGDFDLKMMPHLLRFVGESCKSSGMTCLFLAMRGMPELYARNDASAALAPEVHREHVEEEEIEDEVAEEEAEAAAEEDPVEEEAYAAADEEEQAEEGSAEEDHAHEEQQRPRGPGKYYALFKSLAPKRKFLVRPPSCPFRNAYERGSSGVRYHDVTPEDTFQGICLKYDVTPTELRQANRTSGSNLKLMPDRLIIPVSDGKKRRPACSKECKISSLMSNVAAITRRRLSCMEAQAYLEVADWDVDCAIEDVREDFDSFPQTFV